jgi:hypothetical protein
MPIIRFLAPPTFFVTVSQLQNLRVNSVLVRKRMTNLISLVVSLISKCNAIIAELKAGLGLFGTFPGGVWTFEYQKRGLPHRHILLFLTPEAAALYRDPRNTDRVICAGIPPAADPILREVVTSQMIHGPCGDGHFMCLYMKL